MVFIIKRLLLPGRILYLYGNVIAPFEGPPLEDEDEADTIAGKVIRFMFGLGFRGLNFIFFNMTGSFASFRSSDKLRRIGAKVEEAKEDPFALLLLAIRALAPELVRDEAGESVLELLLILACNADMIKM